MISLLRGTIVEKQKSSLTLLTTGGVGYEVAMAPLAIVDAMVGVEVTLYTYLKVSDSALDVYGFQTKEERNFFTLLMTVSGIGPKSALGILSLGKIENIQNAIARGDVAYLTRVQGMGKKTAERLVVELKNKVMKGVDAASCGGSSVIADVIDGLVAMGYSKEEARQVIEAHKGEEKTPEELLRVALRKLAR